VIEPFDLLVLGDVNPDLVLRGGDVVPAFGQAEHLVDEATLTVGGSGAITACAAVRLGLTVAMCGVVGDDTFGAYMREQLATRGVDTRGIAVDPNRPTGVTVVLSAGDDRAILTSAGTIGDLRRELIDDGLLTAARHVHVSSYFLQPGLAAALPALFAGVREAGGSVSVDPNWDPAGGWDGGLLDLLKVTDVFLPNAVEATRLARTSDLGTAARTLAQHGDVVVIKDGPDGSLAVAGGDLIRQPAPELRPVDTTGAGDAFDAGLIAGLLGGRELPAAMRIANVAGALTTQAPGGVDSVPTMAEVLQVLGEEDAA
jgi:sugar/nucleoside kinase (ribokinase family)